MRSAIRQILFGDMPFSPRLLFLAGEQGAWYDPSDFSTMFQDAAGTIPVTAVGQPVGLLLDKSGRGNHASQTTTTSRPILRQDESGRYYLEFDGTDDWLETSAINFSSTDKMSVFAGVRKLSDASQGILVEMSSSFALNPVSFSIQAPSTAAAQYYVGLYTTTINRYTPITYTAPITNVVTALFDNSQTSLAAKVIPRINGVINQAGPAGTGEGSGNFGNYPLYIGRRGGITGPFNGRIYSLIIRGALTSTPHLEQTERWVSAKTGVTL